MSPTARGPPRKSSTIRRRLGSARAVRVSSTVQVFPERYMHVKAYNAPTRKAIVLNNIDEDVAESCLHSSVRNA